MPPPYGARRRQKQPAAWERKASPPCTPSRKSWASEAGCCGLIVAYTTFIQRKWEPAHGSRRKHHVHEPQEEREPAEQHGGGPHDVCYRKQERGRPAELRCLRGHAQRVRRHDPCA